MRFLAWGMFFIVAATASKSPCSGRVVITEVGDSDIGHDTWVSDDSGDSGVSCTAVQVLSELLVEVDGSAGPDSVIGVSGRYPCEGVVLPVVLCVSLGTSDGMTLIDSVEATPDMASNGTFSAQLDLGAISDILDGDESIPACIGLSDGEAEVVSLSFDLQMGDARSYSDAEFARGVACGC